MNMRKCIYVQLMVYIRLHQERRNTNTVHKSMETDKKNGFTFVEDQKGINTRNKNLQYKNA